MLLTSQSRAKYSLLYFMIAYSKIMFYHNVTHIVQTTMNEHHVEMHIFTLMLTNPLSSVIKHLNFSSNLLVASLICIIIAEIDIICYLNMLCNFAGLFAAC